MSQALAALGVVAGIAIALGVAWPVFRAKSTTATIDLLRTELDVEREARRELERRCGEDTAELRGRLDVVSGTFAATLADRVATSIADAVVSALGRSGVVDRRDGG